MPGRISFCVVDCEHESEAVFGAKQYLLVCLPHRLSQGQEVSRARRMQRVHLVVIFLCGVPVIAVNFANEPATMRVRSSGRRIDKDFGQLDMRRSDGLFTRAT